MGKERCFILHPVLKTGHKYQEKKHSRSSELSLQEAEGLASAVGLEKSQAEIVFLSKFHPGSLFGTGVVERVAQTIEENEIDLLIVNSVLTPVQQRNLERACNCKVIDRTHLIIEIFGKRARTREGRLQVDLAALRYQRSRLVRSWTHLERQRGGAGFMGGPGERQIEIDRRLIDEKIVRLERDLEKVRRTRELHRKSRKKVPFPVIALVGYTNAGKSTLFNYLTESTVFAKSLLFATLDPTMRQLTLPSGRRVILSDTVGFISDLPHELIAAFRATLEEVCEADLIIHVGDTSASDHEKQREDVLQVLAEMGLEDKIDQEELINAYNKIDCLSAEQNAYLDNQTKSQQEAKKAFLISAKNGEGCKRLLQGLDEFLASYTEEFTFHIPAQDGAAIAWLYEHGNVLSSEQEEEIMQITVQLDQSSKERFKTYFGYTDQQNTSS